MLPAIEIRGLVKRYGDVTAVDGLDLVIPQGQCFGLLGPNGAGKTTSLEIMEGLLEPTAGNVMVLGEQWGRDNHALRERIGIALQETKLSERLTVEEIIRLFRSFYAGGRDVEEILERVDLTEKRRAWVVKLSGGQRQRLAIACALVGDPEILFLDEPTTGLDPQSRHGIWDLIRDFQSTGRTVVLTTHYMEEAERLCQRVAVIDHGRIIADGTPQKLIDDLGSGQIIEFTPAAPIPPDLLVDLPGMTSHQALGTGLRIRVRTLQETMPVLLARLKDTEVEVTSLSTHQASLEDVFIALTGRTLREDA